MKKTDLEKNKGLKLNALLNNTPTPGRFGTAAAQVIDKREQRKRDAALGLIPFATKLNAELVQKINARAAAENIGVGEVLTRLLNEALD